MSDGPFQCWRDANGDLWTSPGHAVGIHSSGTVIFQTPDVGASAIATPPVLAEIKPLESPAGQILCGGSGRNWKISNGPAHPDFPTGVFRPAEPDLWDSPRFGLAKVTQAGGTVELHDGVDVVGSMSPGSGTAAGVASAGTFPSQGYAYDSFLDRWIGTGDADMLIYFDTGNGKLTDDTGFTVATRVGPGATPSDPSGTYVSDSYGESTYNGGLPFIYTVTVAGASMTATTHGEDTYNGGSPFTFAAEFEGNIEGRAAFVRVTAGTMQAGRFGWVGWQDWTSDANAAWSLEIDGSGVAQISDGTDVVAERAADSSKLYDGSGLYVSTPYGVATYADDPGDPPFEVTVTTEEKLPGAGYVFVVLTIDSGSNELQGISGQQFAAALPPNTSTEKTFPIAWCEPGKAPVQIQQGPIIWRA
ncbi:hypothetical protein OJ996_09155 [Luteolibacter sp. GHJ8]|uniref:Uncharacterized protein n=1 Tax=Luteolibacter rhizosphaerae TaxID=2989719 RepID=A0ABT3G2J8_9BACT|nr:hypothetical protein [Luteolibacter rhizosphaerae]MCW1913741.1 hypothetical protein [Luteolibacter rhizosphaerae]